MAIGSRTSFRFWNERDVAIDGEIVEDRAAEFLARPIAVRDGRGDLLGLLTGEICGAGIEECANGTGRRKEFDVAKQRQLGNRRSPAEAPERRVEGNLDLLRGLGTDVLNRDKKHAVFKDEIDDDVRAWFHRCPSFYSSVVSRPPYCQQTAFRV